jgi:hypothetical protein
VPASPPSLIAHTLPAQPTLHVLGVLPNHEPVTNELAWHAVEHAFESEDGKLTHSRGDLLELCCTPCWQGPKHRSLGS